MKYLIVTFFVILSTVSFSQNIGKLTGTIVDNVTKQPIIGAKITLTDKNSSAPKRAMTNTEGLYEIPNLAYGSYNMMVTILTFDTVRISIKIDKELVKQDVILGGSQELDEVNVIGNLVKEGKYLLLLQK
jgi:hypothetical protein